MELTGLKVEKLRYHDNWQRWCFRIRTLLEEVTSHKMFVRAILIALTIPLKMQILCKSSRRWIKWQKSSLLR